MLSTTVSSVFFRVMMKPTFQFRRTSGLRHEQTHLKWGEEADRAEGTPVMVYSSSTHVSMLNATVYHKHYAADSVAGPCVWSRSWLMHQG